MRPAKLLTSAATVMFALAAFGPAVAGAEELEPRILCLDAKCAELEASFKGEKAEMQPLSGKKVITTATATLSVGKCETINEGKDIELCKDVPIVFTGVKQEKASCRSEAENGTDKEAPETVAFLLDLHMAAEESEVKLRPLLLGKVLGPLLENAVFVTCGLVKVKMLGTFACLLLPGLTNIAIGATAEILCKVNASHDPETGRCEKLCHWLEEEPFEVGFNGGANEDAWWVLHLTGTTNKDVFIED